LFMYLRKVHLRSFKLADSNIHWEWGRGSLAKASSLRCLSRFHLALNRFPAHSCSHDRSRKDLKLTTHIQESFLLRSFPSSLVFLMKDPIHNLALLNLISKTDVQDAGSHRSIQLDSVILSIPAWGQSHGVYKHQMIASLTFLNLLEGAVHEHWLFNRYLQSSCIVYQTCQ
jgi:hypothetical protein